MIFLINQTGNQLYILLTFFVTGIIIGIIFDFFRILRKSFKTSNIVTYIEDLLFWLLSGFLIILVIFNFTNGEIRIYMIVSLACATLLYFLLISKYIVGTVSNIIIFIKTKIFQFFENFQKLFRKK